METLSILNPPIIDFNDRRLTSEDLLKTMGEQDSIIRQRLKDLSEQMKPGDITPFNLMVFTCLQHHLHVTTLNTKLTARQMDLTYKTTQLTVRLEGLTKWLIGLTIVLAIFTLPLAIEAIEKWLK
jgi:hypothetical protein